MGDRTLEPGRRDGRRDPIGENKLDYSMGNSWRLSDGRSAMTERRAFTSRLDINTWGDVSGADPSLHLTWMPSNNPIWCPAIAPTGVGLNWFLPWGSEGNRGTRFALELAIPIYQSLDGPQLETNWQLRGGVQWIF